MILKNLERTLYLASKSPRRRELLKNLGINYQIIDVDVDESVEKYDSPEEFVTVVAKRKVTAAGKKVEKGYVLSADTIVYLDGSILEKPADRIEAQGMLQMLQGNVHQVYTGVAVTSVPEKKTLVGFEATDVKFASMSNDEINWYLDTGEYSDKAGAYAIQGKCGIFIESISGCYYNVVGLPLQMMYRLIDKLVNE